MSSFEDGYRLGFVAGDATQLLGGGSVSEAAAGYAVGLVDSIWPPCDEVIRKMALGVISVAMKIQRLEKRHEHR